MLYWIWLTQIKGVGPVTGKILLKQFKTPENIYKASIKELLECNGIGEITAERILKSKSLQKAEIILKEAKKLGINILTLDNPLYPDEVKNIKETPILLYYKGSLTPNSIGVSIVGARRCSDYGKQVTKDSATFLAKNKIPIISGMAKGIDGYAHTACLQAGGYTIAILGNGLDICYPSEHRELMEKIIEKGAVISEYPPGTNPNPKHFPRRNLLISAWSHKILVIEAGAKSGALITAQYAKKQNKELLAVPNNIYQLESIGSNQLIREGANIYLHAEQLLIQNKISIHKDIQTIKQNNDTNQTDLNKVETKIIRILLNEGEKTIEELSESLKKGKMEILEKVSLMELENKIILQGTFVKLS